MMKRVLGAAGVGLLMSCVGALTACSTPSAEEENTQSGAAALESANVSIDLYDSNGSKVGEGAGVLIAPNLVLTAAHLVAGNTNWKITTADGKKTANGKRGITYDWHDYDSLKAHPRKHDVAVIYLDKPITLSAYPKIANDVQANGTAAMRVRNLKGTFDLVKADLGKVRNFPHAYTSAMSKTESVNTGGAVINGAGEIVGVVTGRGMQSGALYIARTAGLSSFLSPKLMCAGGKATSGLSVRTYGAPPPKPGCEKDGSGKPGTPGGPGGGGPGPDGVPGTKDDPGGPGPDGIPGTKDDVPPGSEGGPNGPGGGGPGADGIPGTKDDPGGPGPDGVPGTKDDVPPGSNSGGSDGTNGGTTGGAGGEDGKSGGGKCDDGGGNCSGNCSGGAGGDDTSGGNTSGSDGTNSAGPDGIPGTSDDVVGGGGGSAGPDGIPGTSDDVVGGGGGTDPGSNTGSSDGLPGSKSGGGGGGGGGGAGDEEVCEGPSDNPDECPPEAAGCEGPECGGSTPGKAPDTTIDYGNCACSGSATSGTLPVIR